MDVDPHSQVSADAGSGSRRSFEDKKLQDAGTGGIAIEEKDALTPVADGDDALRADSIGIVVSEEENKALLRKIDRHLMPLMILVYGIQYLDKTTLSYASIMGLRKDTNISGGQYSTINSIFYVGYLVFEFPTNRLLQWLPLAKYSAANIITWGAVLCCMAACSNFAGLMTVRFFLGVFESSVTPGFTLIVSRYYRKEEQGRRTGWWFSANGGGQIVGGCIAYGLARADAAGKLAIAGWRVVFLLTGCMTIALGLLVFLFVPDSSLTARWLNSHERQLAVERLRSNNQGIGNRHYKLEQVKEAFTDPMVWLFVLYSLVGDIPNGGTTSYFSILIQSFGFSSVDSLLLGTPGGAVEIVAILLLLHLGDRYHRRCLFGAAGVAVALLGILLIYCLPDEMKVGRLIGYYFTLASAPGFVALLSLLASNVAGYTKKTTASAMFLVAYCVGNLIGPQAFRDKDAPRYTPAMITIVVCQSLCILILCLIDFLYRRENRRRDRIVSSPDYVHRPNQAFMDMTDRQNMEFRYST